MRSSTKRAEDERQTEGRITVRGTRRIKGGGDRDVEGKTDGGVRGRLGYLQITSLRDRFSWRLNWARGLRGESV